MTLHLMAFRAIFTKLCMSKVQYVGGKHMTSYKCVTSFRRKAAILLSEYVQNAPGITIINAYVFRTDYKRKKHY